MNVSCWLSVVWLLSCFIALCPTKQCKINLQSKHEISFQTSWNLGQAVLPQWPVCYRQVILSVPSTSHFCPKNDAASRLSESLPFLFCSSLSGLAGGLLTKLLQRWKCSPVAFIKAFQKLLCAASTAHSNCRKFWQPLSRDCTELKPVPIAICSLHKRSWAHWSELYSLELSTVYWVTLTGIWEVPQSCQELVLQPVVNVVTLPHCLCGRLDPSINKTWCLSARINSVQELFEDGS